MKIDNSKIFVGDVKRVISTKTTTIFNTNNVSFGTTEYKTEDIKDNVVLIAVKTSHMGIQYVPVSFFKKGLLSLLSIKHAAQGNTYGDKRFLSKGEVGSNADGLYVEDVKHLYSTVGKTDLKDIKTMQYLISEKVIGGTL